MESRSLFFSGLHYMY